MRGETSHTRLFDIFIRCIKSEVYFYECDNRETLLKGWISTVDLLELTSLDQLLFILKILLTFFTKQPTLMRRSTVLSLPIQLEFPGDKVRKLMKISTDC